MIVRGVFFRWRTEKRSDTKILNILDTKGAAPGGSWRGRPVLDERVDLLVVGGGYTGLWTAVRAKERNPGRSVVVVEAKRVGWAASGRNGGFVEASLTHGEENGQRRWPEELHELDRLGHENLDAIEGRRPSGRQRVEAPSSLTAPLRWLL